MTHAKAPASSAYVFPKRERFEREIAKIPTTMTSWAGSEGPRFRLELSPGSVRVTSTDLSKKNTAAEAATARLRLEVDQLVAEMTSPDASPPPRKRGTVKAWSLKSRSRMTLRLATLDYSPLFADGRPPAMTTLTFPHDWEYLAPTAQSFKKLVNRFRARYEAAWGAPMAGIWKMEFQWRKNCAAAECHDPAAPHLHIIMTPPEGTAYAPRSLDDLCHVYGCGESCSAGTHENGRQEFSCGLPACTHPAHSQQYEFAEWLSRSWADSVGAEDPAERRKHERAGTGVDYDELSNYADPKRIGIYFSKHGLYADKEYQNTLPKLWQAADAGGVRFWGYWVVRPLIVSKEAHELLITHVVRHLRALADRNAYSRVVTTKWVRESREVTSPEWVLDVETGEVTQQMQSTWVTTSRPESRKRKVRRRVKRWRTLHGFEVVNDSLGMVDSIVRVMHAHLPSVSEAEGYDLRLLSPPDEPDWFSA